MMFLNKETLEGLRKTYPTGTRVELVQMDDPQAPPVGTRGTVRGVDDVGSILMTWDNGSGLNVAYGEDVVKKLDSVTVICYGKEEKWDIRDEAIAFYKEACAECDPNGSEWQRYKIVLDSLIAGETECRDEPREEKPVPTGAWDGIVKDKTEKEKLNYKLSARIYRLQDNLSRAGAALDRAKTANITKDRMRKYIEVAEGLMAKERLIGIQSVFEKAEPLNASNGLTDELDLIKNDLGTALYLIANGKTREAEELIVSVKDRI